MAGSNDLNSHDRAILRALAGQVAEMAHRPCEDAKRRLWYDHNALKPTRPVIFCDPENGWNEIVTPQSLECEDGFARACEVHLRKELFWAGQMRDDKVIEPRFELNYAATDTGWGVPIEHHGGQQGGAYNWEPPIKSREDLARLRVPQVNVDTDETARRVGLLADAFGDLLKVHVRASWWWSLGMTQLLVYLRGIEQVMIDMCEQPQLVHDLMAFLRDAHLELLDFYETNGLLSPNHDGAYVGSGGFGYTTELPQAGCDLSHCRLRDMWGFAESQETTSVSPAMFEEFIFPYQEALLQRFGLNCYGCCEPLHRRWHVVRRFPRLRRVSVSPWADIRAMAENLGDRYVFSMKPNPAHLARPSIDEDFIRRTLREALEATRGCRVEVVMKDCHTICGNPQNVVRWTRIAMEESDRLGA